MRIESALFITKQVLNNPFSVKINKLIPIDPTDPCRIWTMCRVSRNTHSRSTNAQITTNTWPFQSFTMFGVELVTASAPVKF